MNCIIGGNRNNCDFLEGFISKSSALNLVGIFSDEVSIKNQISEGKDIDLIFLDIESPEIDFLNFSNSLDNQPNIIVISGSDQNALKAFEFDVVDYLIRPVTYARFIKAVDKAIRYHSPKESKNSDENEVFIKKDSSLIKLRLRDLIYIEALENYIILHTAGEKYTIHFTMKAIENQLPSAVFIRVHRSFIINKSKIQAIREDTLDIKLGDKLKNIPVGNSFRERLMNNLNMIVR